MTDLFDLASSLEHEPADASPEEMIAFASVQASDSAANAHGGVRALADSVRQADAAARDRKLGAPGSLAGAGGAHAASLRELAQQAQAHRTAHAAIDADRRLSDVGRREAHDALREQQTKEREEALAKATECVESILGAREKALLEELGRPAVQPKEDAFLAAVARLETLQRASMYEASLRRLKPSARVQAMLELLGRDPDVGPHLLRATAVAFAGDDAHLQQLSTLVTSAAAERHEARVRKVFDDRSSPRARAAVELALLRSLRERHELHREQIRLQPDSAAPLLDAFGQQKA